MNILVINDDGFNSVYTNTLCEYLTSKMHNVYASLPMRNRSGVSGGITLNQRIEIINVNDKTIILSGTPVDCLHFGIYWLKQRGINIDMVISGINRGLNYGTTVFYSGTVAAALEANLYGINNIAISIDERYDSSLVQNERLYRLLEKVIEFINSNTLKCATVNLNLFGFGEFKRTFHMEFENELFDRNYILPIVGIEKNSAILYPNIDTIKLKHSNNMILCGIVSRNFGLLMEPEYRVWFEKLKNYINGNR